MAETKTKPCMNEEVWMLGLVRHFTEMVSSITMFLVWMEREIHTDSNDVRIKAVSIIPSELRAFQCAPNMCVQFFCLGNELCTHPMI